MINICYDEIFFICGGDKARFVSDLLKNLKKSFERKDFLFKLSFKGVGMKGVPGIMYSIYSAFEKENIVILRTTDSHTTISCLLDKENLEKSIRLLRSDFGLKENNIMFEKKK